MTGFSPRAARSVEVARRVQKLLAANALDSAVIGSIALALHGYVRATRDLDLGVALVSFGPLAKIAARLRADGFDVHVGEPAPDDELGGVVTVNGPDFDPIQIVNLTAPGGKRGKLARAAIAAAQRVPELDLPVVDVPHLIALKLVAGGRKDELDVLELLDANPTEPLSRVREVCKQHRLGAALERVLAQRGRRG
jgi:hypothetical protein